MSNSIRQHFTVEVEIPGSVLGSQALEASVHLTIDAAAMKVKDQMLSWSRDYFDFEEGSYFLHGGAMSRRAERQHA